MQTLEYLQTQIATLTSYINDLQQVINDHTDNWHDYDPYSPISTYMIQLRFMQQYQSILQYRINLLTYAEV